MEQENGQIKSRCHSAAKEGAQTVQRPACLKYSLDSYRPYQQVKQQVKLSGWNGITHEKASNTTKQIRIETALGNARRKTEGRKRPVILLLSGSKEMKKAG